MVDVGCGQVSWLGLRLELTWHGVCIYLKKLVALAVVLL